MIYTVTFNPAIDYVVRLDAPLEVGEVNRAKGEDCVLGGKGINVSGVLAQLGCESVALGFVAGETGAWLERGLAAQGITTDFIHLEQGMTRINVKIKAGQETELNGAGPDIPESAMEQLEAQLQDLIGQIDGAGATTVMVTLETGEETVYATDTQSGQTQSQETHVLLDDGTALAQTVYYPQVCGVAVVCDGGGDVRGAARITELVRALLDISSTRICVERRRP